MFGRYGSGSDGGGMTLAGKIAVVTGAGRGIGRRMAMDFAAAGAKVVAAARTAETLDSLIDEIRETGGTAIAVPTDIGRITDCEALMNRAIEEFGTIDVLVNNAAISGPNKLIRDLEPDEWEEIIRVNLTGTWACIHFAVAPMMEQKSGSIINISSFAGKFPVARRVGYSSSKAALVGLTRGLALELGPYGIRINNITPGPVEGERVDEVIARMSKALDKPKDEIRDQFLDMSPLHEMATADDISRMALMLASDDGGHMTGQDINLTAGIVMY